MKILIILLLMTQVCWANLGDGICLDKDKSKCYNGASAYCMNGLWLCGWKSYDDPDSKYRILRIKPPSPPKYKCHEEMIETNKSCDYNPKDIAFNNKFTKIVDGACSSWLMPTGNTICEPMEDK